jgi:hypothetical protein
MSFTRSHRTSAPRRYVAAVRACALPMGGNRLSGAFGGGVEKSRLCAPGKQVGEAAAS